MTANLIEDKFAMRSQLSVTLYLCYVFAMCSLFLQACKVLRQRLYQISSKSAACLFVGARNKAAVSCTVSQRVFDH